MMVHVWLARDNMPYYDYKCNECGHMVKDHMKKMSEPHPTKCPECEKESLSLSYDHYDALVQYKGGKWFKKDGSY
jgi:putative FmdB family regulatory protein